MKRSCVPDMSYNTTPYTQSVPFYTDSTVRKKSCEPDILRNTTPYIHNLYLFPLTVGKRSYEPDMSYNTTPYTQSVPFYTDSTVRKRS